VEPIVVPAPPKSAFNKNRPLSDLLVGQLRHFQHVEHKQGIEIDRASASDLHTEAGAARYITQMTRAIRSQAGMKSSGAGVVAPITPGGKSISTAPRKRARGGSLSLAAVSQTPRLSSPKTTKSGKKKKKNNARKKS
jgi:hypothetical protein